MNMSSRLDVKMNQFGGCPQEATFGVTVTKFHKQMHIAFLLLDII